MKLWYTLPEIREAKQDAQRLIDQYNKELPLYGFGKATLRMAWKEDTRSREIVPLDEFRMYEERSLPVFIPEADLLFDGEVVRHDLLDLLLIDINHLQMKVLQKAGRCLFDG